MKHNTVILNKWADAPMVLNETLAIRQLGSSCSGRQISEFDRYHLRSKVNLPKYKATVDLPSIAIKVNNVNDDILLN